MLNKIQELKIYFIGIGGISMSALALYLYQNNFSVEGSDKSLSEQVINLKNKGIKVYLESNLNAIKSSDIIVYSSSISKDNVEYQTAIKLKKAIYKRSQLLNLISNSFKESIGIAGSHGKTSTTAILSHILYKANKSFTTHIGGYDDTFSNLYTNGEKEIFLSEVCEFDKSINDITSTYALVTNVDNDHLDCYESEEEISKTFYNYLDRAKYKIINVEDKYLKNYVGKNVITYGINSGDVHTKNLKSLLGKYSFDVIIKGENKGRIVLNVFGKTAVYNTLASISIAYLLNVSFKDILNGISSYSGVKRRFEYIGKYKNKRIICDYAHHPTEISECIKTAKDVFKNNCLFIFQPHTYSRTKLLFNKFLSVLYDENVVIYKTYGAREEYLYYSSGEYLASELSKEYLENENQLKDKIKNAKESNIVLIGAGDLYDIAKSIVK